MEEQLRLDALEYHRVPTPGKISVTPTKSLVKLFSAQQNPRTCSRKRQRCAAFST